jgi:hypothetical protein
MHEPHFFHNRQTFRQPHRLPEEPSVELVITSGRARKRIRRVIGPVFLIGSSMDCDLILGDPLIPAVHSYVLMTTHGVRLRHLGESPEVQVNSQVLEVTQLEDQDQITIGCFAFLVRIAWPAACRPLLSLTADAPVPAHAGPAPLAPAWSAPWQAPPLRRRQI